MRRLIQVVFHDPSVTAFQIAIAISAISILTRRKKLWYGGLLLTIVGIVFLIMGILP